MFDTLLEAANVTADAGRLPFHLLWVRLVYPPAA
jgi:hypothetical protein